DVWKREAIQTAEGIIRRSFVDNEQLPIPVCLPDDRCDSLRHKVLTVPRGDNDGYEGIVIHAAFGGFVASCRYRRQALSHAFGKSLSRAHACVRARPQGAAAFSTRRAWPASPAGGHTRFWRRDGT